MWKHQKKMERKRVANPMDTRREPQQTVVKGKKIGRNDPCPCGSGKKYKKCCGKQSIPLGKIGNFELELELLSLHNLELYIVQRKGANMEEIYLYKEKLEEIKGMVDELGVSL